MGAPTRTVVFAAIALTTLAACGGDDSSTPRSSTSTGTGEGGAASTSTSSTGGQAGATTTSGSSSSSGTATGGSTAGSGGATTTSGSGGTTSSSGAGGTTTGSGGAVSSSSSGGGISAGGTSGSGGSATGGAPATGGAGGAGGSSGTGGAGGQACNDQVYHPTSGANAANATWGSDNGTTCATAMWSCVDDATPDDDHTYVYASASGGYHTVSYLNAPAAPATSVTVHVVAEQPTGSGSVTLTLYDGATLIGTGTAHALTATYAEYTDTFNVSVSNASNLKTRVTMSATGGRYTQVYISMPVCGPIDPVLVGAGDISCDAADRMMSLPCKDSFTAQTATNFNPAAVFALGDNQYEDGSLANYQTFYSASWGVASLLASTRPAIGDREYNGNDLAACGTTTPNACSHNAYMKENYFTYFQSELATADPNGNGWYSYDVPTSGEPWHVVVLNAAICDTASYPDAWADPVNCASTSAQYDWLVNKDLPQFQAAHPNAKCIVAMWHEPRFSSGQHGPNVAYQPFWEALYNAHAEIILNGHDHLYERFNPQTPTGGSDPTHGIVQFTVGVGGRDTTACSSSQPNSAKCASGSQGVLALTLHSGSADYIYVNSSGPTVTDAGTIVCHD